MEAAFVHSIPSPFCPSHLTRSSIICPRTIQTKRLLHNRRPFLTTACAKTDDARSVKSTPTAFTWSVGSSNREVPLESLQEAIARAATTFTVLNRTVSVAFIFIKSTFETAPGANMRSVIKTVKKTLAIKRLLSPDTQIFGCTSAHFVESDEQSSASVALAHFPVGTTLNTFHIDEQSESKIDWKQDRWYDLVGISPTTDNFMGIFLLQHPDYEQTEDLLSGLDFAYPGARKFGASAGKTNVLHEAYLFHTDDHVNQGLIGLAFSSPDVQVDVMVAQGARGVGPIVEVREVKNGNEITVVKEVNTATTTTAAPMTLLDMWSKTDQISYEDGVLAKKYLLFGVEVQKVVDLAVSSLQDDYKEKVAKESQQPIDMVIRKVVGFNEATKSLGIETKDVRLGSRAQFQIRDKQAAQAELQTLFNKMSLEASSKAMDGMSLMGAVLLVDLERGVNLFGDVMPDSDRALFFERFPVGLVMLSSNRQLGPLPSGGLFGEAGNTFSLSASALYISFYGRTGKAITEKDGART